AIMEIFFGLFPRRPASDDPDRIAADLCSLHPRGFLGPADPLRSLFERSARGLKEKRVAVLHRKCLPGRRCASVHDPRPRRAKWLRLAADCFHIEVFARKVEIFAIGPDHPDDIDPFLRIFVTLLVRALLDAEHVELALVPADDDVEPKAALADMIGCDHFLRRDYRIDDRRMHRAEDGDALG